MYVHVQYIHTNVCAFNCWGKKERGTKKQIKKTRFRQGAFLHLLRPLSLLNGDWRVDFAYILGGVFLSQLSHLVALLKLTVSPPTAHRLANLTSD